MERGGELGAVRGQVRIHSCGDTASLRGKNRQRCRATQPGPRPYHLGASLTQNRVGSQRNAAADIYREIARQFEYPIDLLNVRANVHCLFFSQLARILSGDEP